MNFSPPGSIPVSNTYKKPENVGKKSILGIRIAAVLFLIVFTALLVTNIWLANSLEEDSSGINLAGRQRMLSQRMTKAINALNTNLVNENLPAAEVAQEELQLAYSLFNTTLEAFREGGTTKGPDGSEVYIQRLPAGSARQDVMDASSIWNPLSKEISFVSVAPLDQLDRDSLSAVVTNLGENNLKLLKLMNGLTVKLEESANSKTNLQQIILGSALFLVFGNFSYVVLFALRSLKARDREISDYSQTLEKNFQELQGAYGNLEKIQGELSTTNESLHATMISLDEANKAETARANEMEVLSANLGRMKEESDKIFDSVDHGLCLLDENFVISSRVSAEMYEIFETEQLTDRSFLDLLRPLIPEKELTTLKSFLTLHFQNKVINEQLEKYNPLKKIEISLNWDGDSFVTKHLAFQFERIYEGEKVIAVLVTITDITSTVALENKLLRAGEAQQRRTDLLLEVINGDADELKVFLGQTESTLNEINHLLKDRNDQDSDTAEHGSKELVEEVFRRVHNIKGNASLLGLNTIVEITHSIEDSLSELRREDIVQGEEFLNSLVELATLRERVNEYDEITHTILKDFASSRPKRNDTGPKPKEEAFDEEIRELNTRIADELGKKVFTKSFVELDELSDHGLSHIKDLTIQLCRNAVFHGIETPAERARAGKLEQGAITVVLAKDTSTGAPAYRLQVRDDGRGINLEELRSQVVAKGFVSEEEASGLGRKELVSCLFAPQFSSAESVSEHAGRGIGLNLIKETVMARLGGKLSVSFGKGTFMQFSCTIPAESLETDSAALT